MSTFPGPGDRLGRYDVVGVLGRGGMGVVFRAEHRELGRSVALKVMNPLLDRDPDYRRRFLHEAQVLARLDSRHVVRVHDAGDQDDWLFIATELVEGGTLEDLLHRRHVLPPAVATRLAAEAARGLADAHRAGVLHRDLKPSNVLLRTAPDGSLSAVLCDLGIAKSSDDPHVTTEFLGTPGYMAPERHDGRSASVASDVYELGCVLWTLLTGAPPYRGTLAQVARAHLEAPVPQLPGPPPHVGRLNALLGAVLAKDPAVRPPSAETLAIELEACTDVVRGLPPLVSPPGASTPGSSAPNSPAPGWTPVPPPNPAGPPPAAPQPGRGRRTAVAVTAVVVVVLLVVGGVVALLVARDDGGDGAVQGTGQTGPSVVPTSGPSTTGATGAVPVSDPQVGECHQLQYSDLEARSDDSPVVPCDGADALTFHVGRLTSRDSTAADVAGAGCYRPLAAALGVSVAEVNASALSFVFFEPDAAEWAAGARWLRCDAVILDGTSLRPVPADLGRVFSRGEVTAAYRACLDAAHQPGPCTSGSAYDFAGSRQLSGPEAFPGDTVLHARAEPLCQNLVGPDWWATWPAADSWRAGRRTITCWRPRG